GPAHNCYRREIETYLAPSAGMSKHGSEQPPVFMSRNCIRTSLKQRQQPRIDQLHGCDDSGDYKNNQRGQWELVRQWHGIRGYLSEHGLAQLQQYTKANAVRDLLKGLFIPGDRHVHRLAQW